MSKLSHQKAHADEQTNFSLTSDSNVVKTRLSDSLVWNGLVDSSFDSRLADLRFDSLAGLHFFTALLLLLLRLLLFPLFFLPLHLHFLLLGGCARLVQWWHYRLPSNLSLHSNFAGRGSNILKPRGLNSVAWEKCISIISPKCFPPPPPALLPTTPPASAISPGPPSVVLSWCVSGVAISLSFSLAHRHRKQL